MRHRQHRVALVPLDSRPCNARLPRLLGTMVDYEVLIPPEESLGSFTRPGNCEEIAAWLRGVAGEVDCVVVSIDMLAFGGLEPSCTTQCSLDASISHLHILRELRREHRDLAVFCFNAITRSSIPTWADRSGHDVQRIRRYGELQDRVRRLGEKDLREEMLDLEKEIPGDLLSDYLSTRERNHQVNRHAVEMAADGSIDFLVLGQDEASEFGPHRNEQDALESLAEKKGVADAVVVCSGIDEMGMCLLARFINTHMLRTPSVAVIYSSDDAPDRVAPLEDRTLRETVRQHIVVTGCEEAIGPADADLVMFVNAPADGDREAVTEDETTYLQRCSDLEEFVESIASQTASERPTVVADAAFPDGADPVLIALLLERVSVHRLASYAGWRTPANAVGSALAQGCTRLVALQDRGAFNLAHSLGQLNTLRYLSLLDSLIDSEKTHIEFLFARLVEDWAYQTRVRQMATEHITRRICTSALDLARSRAEAEDFVRMHLTQAAHELYLNHFLGRRSAQIGSGDEPAHLMLCELEELHVRLPWGRLREVDLGCRFGVQLVADRGATSPAELAGEEAVS